MQTIPTSPPTTGEFLYNVTSKYLEAYEFENCDFGCHFLPESKYGERPGIGLGHSDDALGICTVTATTFERSDWLELRDHEQINKLLDILCFTIKTLQITPNETN